MKWWHVSYWIENLCNLGKVENWAIMLNQYRCQSPPIPCWWETVANWNLIRLAPLGCARHNCLPICTKEKKNKEDKIGEYIKKQVPLTPYHQVQIMSIASAHFLGWSLFLHHLVFTSREPLLSQLDLVLYLFLTCFDGWHKICIPHGQWYWATET